MKNKDLKYFYKYQTINSLILEEDRALDALFKRFAIFSNRKNFNDPFDSKIKLIAPTIDEVKDLLNKLDADKKNYMIRVFFKDEFSFEKNIEKIEKEFNNLIDEYFFYCVSDDATNNLMWSHYANSHYGFCIEFNTGFVPAQEVIYQKKVVSLNLIEVIKLGLKLTDGKDLSKNVWYSLRTKLDEWKYESEYRVHANNQMIKESLERQEKFVKIGYKANAVESIIFGYRMNKETRDYIIKNIPYKVKFKESIITDNSFRIVEYKVY
jgi:hypothetical protein